MIDIITEIFPISKDAQNHLMNLMEEKHFEKGTLLMKANRLEKHIYLVKKGIVRAYSDHEDGEITFWFGEEGSAVLSMKSYVENKKSYENIELLEAGTLYEISIEKLQLLFEQNIEVANWGRKLAERELLKLETRMISRELLSARLRYEEILIHCPSLIKRVSLKYIASYLGITPVSLSRIRKEI